MSVQHVYWRIARGPFWAVTCKQHTWERYGVMNAGCIKCGCEHECQPDILTKQCNIIQQEDGGLCCMITGYCPNVVRYSESEFVDTCTYRQVKHHEPSVTNAEEIQAVVEWFLLGNTSHDFRQLEVGRILSKCKNLFIKFLKQDKLKSCNRPAFP